MHEKHWKNNIYLQISDQSKTSIILRCLYKSIGRQIRLVQIQLLQLHEVLLLIDSGI